MGDTTWALEEAGADAGGAAAAVALRGTRGAPGGVASSRAAAVAAQPDGCARIVREADGGETACTVAGAASTAPAEGALNTAVTASANERGGAAAAREEGVERARVP